MEEERFKNVNILDLANIVFFHEDLTEPVLNLLVKDKSILERISDEIREQSLDILSDKNSIMMNRQVEENLTYLSNLYMLLKKKGVRDVNAK